MRILVTGGCGFIGSNYIRHRIDSSEDSIVNLDLLTYAGNINNLKSLARPQQYGFVKGDICDEELVDDLFSDNDFDAVVHFAAESHVDRSISGPKVFVTTNVLGTQTLLEAARRHWGNSPEKRFIHISTDEVYGELGKEGSFTEDTPYAPNSPYSASKAGADHMARAYYRTYGLPVIITNCSNNYGPYQFPEKLIPLMITNAIDGLPLPVYGDGGNVRDWLFVGDHCRAIDAVLERGVAGRTYNIGGHNEWTNLSIVKKILEYMNKPESLIQFVQDRPGHDRRYAINADRITEELGWSPSTDALTGLQGTVQWYANNEWWWRPLKEKGREK